MNKVTTAIVLTLLFGAQHVFAQVYYPTQTPYQTSTYGSCVNISKDLSVGSRGSDVLALQKFILSRNYPGGGSWMLTSYYGAATRAGVINIQIDMHLPQTGILDAQTRAALSQATCGYGYNQPQPTQNYPWSFNQPWYNYNSYTYGNNYNGNCSAVFGSSACQCGWYTVAGQNYFNDCGPNNPFNTIYPNNYYPYNNYGGQYAPSISNVSGPTSLNVNTTGTWIISVNYPNNQFGNYATISVDWGDPVYGAYLAAPQQLTSVSQSATFTHAYSQSGTYTVRFTVTNQYGSNTSTITVTVGSSNTNTNAPSITNITGPNSLNVNTSGTWSVSVNNPYNATYTSISVNWGDPVYGLYMAAPQQVYGTGTATFSHAYSQSGTYTITFTASNSYGSNSATKTVQVGTNTSGTPWIYSITPTYGPVGTQITIYGTGFSGDNTVHFGNGGRMHVTSASGNYIYLTVPSYLSPCDVQVSGTYCAQYIQNVTPGQYPIYVTTNGTNSNSLTFTVQ